MQQCKECMTDFRRALTESGYPEAQIGVSGSSITGHSYRPPHYSFDKNPRGKLSDIDVFFVSDKVKHRITAEIWVESNSALKIWSEEWTKILGREITPMGFKKIRERPSLILKD